MTRRRVFYWINVGVNGIAVLANLVAISLDLRAGRSIVLSTFAGIVGVVVIYGVTAIDTWVASREAILAAQRRCAEAQAAMQEEMLAKLTKASVEIGLEVGDRDTSRAH